MNSQAKSQQKSAIGTIEKRTDSQVYKWSSLAAKCIEKASLSIILRDGKSICIFYIRDWQSKKRVLRDKKD